MSNELSLIDSIKQQLAQLPQTGVDAETAAVAGSGGGKRISIRGGVFRKYVSGKEVAAVPERHMHIIFVKMAATPARMFYTEAFEEGKRVSPSCWSSDSDKPDPAVAKPVASSCRTCPMSIKGSGRDGKLSACRLSWRTAVVLPNDPSGDVMQLVIPSQSVWGDEYNGTRPFKAYIRYLAENNISAGRVITKMEFDLRQPSPRLLFSPVGAVPLEVLPEIEKQNKSQAAELAVKLTMFHTDASADEEVEVAQPAQLAAPIVNPVLVPVDFKAEVPHEAVPEPTLREEPKKVVDEPKMQDAPKPEVSEIIKRWTKKA